ncbi:hypothetical protein NM208_g6439 [Fusarium decemcellulare]|uniref:Uncharacterized protein n=1 Tax=Fusarium decemcellulare TaxID=57161 RepID=A0ACC1SD02_9HYPO|nr:hypothetical protein NM208_g6439 [Fusarium decemcellulare]
MIYLVVLLLLPALSVTSPTHFSDGGSPIQTRDDRADARHARTLAEHPKDLVLHSRDLYEFFKRNEGTDEVVYLQDKRVFVPMSSVSAPEQSKRQVATPCWVHDQWDATDAKSEWGPWEPASECLYTGESEGGGVVGITWSKSVAVMNEAGLDWSPIKDVLKVSLGFSVTNTWTDGGKIDCTVPAKSVGQIWVQKYMGEAKMKKRRCQDCGAASDCRDWEDAGFIRAPSDGSDSTKNRNTGCSTGLEDVQC